MKATTTQQKRDRLQYVAKLMRDVYEQATPFCLLAWYAAAPPCGYVACAVGHACLDPRINSQGLRLERESPSYRGLTQWEAVDAFFGLDSRDSNWLFSAKKYPAGGCTNALEVALRIEEFLAHSRFRVDVADCRYKG